MNSKSATGYLKYASIYFFYFLAMGVFSSMLSVYLTGTGKGAADTALIVSASGVFTMILQPFIGMLYDRSGQERRLSAVLLVLAAIAGVLFAFTKRTLLLFLLNGLVTGFLNSVNPVCERIAASSPYRYGIVRLWGAVGYAVACQASGLIFERISPVVNFVLFAIAALLTCAGLYAIGDMPTERKEKTAEANGSVKDLLTNPGYLVFVLICLLFSGVTTAGGIYVPVLLNELTGSTTTVGTILFLGTLMEIPIIFLSNRFMDRLSGKQLLLINTALVVVQFAFYSFCRNAFVLGAVVFFSKSVSTMLFIMVTLKVVMDLTGGSYANTALAFAATCKAVGGLLVTTVCGFLIDAAGLKTAFLMLTAVAAAALLCAAFIRLPKGEKAYFSGEA